MEQQLKFGIMVYVQGFYLHLVSESKEVKVVENSLTRTSCDCIICITSQSHIERSTLCKSSLIAQLELQSSSVYFRNYERYKCLSLSVRLSTAVFLTAESIKVDIFSALVRLVLRTHGQSEHFYICGINDGGSRFF